jgi:predicted RNase H-related nuclease YkuK (DUF458 family)
MKKLNIEEITEYLRHESITSNVYIGVDSERFKDKGMWFADYTIAVVIHRNGNNGCKIFGGIDTAQDFDSKSNKPMLRMMNEVYRASETYLALAEVLVDRNVEIHLDINPSELHGSNCAMQQAIGYIKGVCGHTPKLKPEAFAASYAADRLKEYI